MKIISISNLYPRPDQPTRGMFNAQLFGEMGKGVGFRVQGSGFTFLNICLVPEWRVWRWRAIRKWEAPVGVATDDRPQTTYLPVFYLPYIGRSINWWFYYRAIMRRAWQSRPTEEGNLELGRARQPWRAEELEGRRAWQSRPTEEGNLELGRARQPWRAEDVILASWLYPDAVAVARVAHDLGAPVWLRVHGTDRYHLKNRCRRRLILDAVRYAQGMICNCKAVADDLVKFGVPADKLHIVPNGVDTALFRYRGKGEVGGGLEIQGSTYAVSATADKSGFRVQDNQSATVLFIGNLVPIKGPDVLLRAFAEIIRGTKDPEKKKIFEQKDAKHAKGECVHSADMPAGAPAHSRTQEGGGEESSSLCSSRPSVQNPHLLIIGGGPLRGKLERMAKELGIADRVHFLGNRPHGEIALWMNVADVLCLTSRSEGMPNVVAEALASGLPVVATDVGACPELLANEPSARLCRSGDVDALAGALREVLDMTVDRQALAARHSKHYSWEGQAKTLLNVMEIETPDPNALPRGAGIE